MSSNNKKTFGQFYTTNYKYILQNLEIPLNVKRVIEPFAGKCDLDNFIPKNRNFESIEYYDIEPKNNKVVKKDTLLEPPSYDNKFILTNPPYLARNKSDNDKKEIYDKYNQNDLYKCFIESVINSGCLGGILIIPLNFWSSIRKNDILLRKKFIEKFNIVKLNIFEETVFTDTTYTICSFQFEKKTDNLIKEITANIYPSKKEINFKLFEENNYTIGGEIYKLNINDKIIVERATSKTKNNVNDGLTNILVKCIDDSLENKISLTYIENKPILENTSSTDTNNETEETKKNNKYLEDYIDNTDKLSMRSYAILIIKPKLTITKQKKLINDFNKYINKQRNKYNSLFLTNYRNCNNIARKRISFALVFDIVNYLLSKSKIDTDY